VSARHFGTGAELSGHFGTSLMVPKWSEVSWVRNVASYKMRKCEIAKVNMCKQQKWDNAKVTLKATT